MLSIRSKITRYGKVLEKVLPILLTKSIVSVVAIFSSESIGLSSCNTLYVSIGNGIGNIILKY